MYAAPCHLIFGNAVIAVIEGLILSAVFGTSKRRAIGFMLIANYLSTWGGMVPLAAVQACLPFTLSSARASIWVMIGVAYLMTLVPEWPFVALCLRGKTRWLSKSVLGSLLVQSATYVVLVWWYWSASGTSLYTETDIVQLSQIRLPEDVVLYYISDQDGDVYRRRLAGPDERICDLNSAGYDDRLAVQQNAAHTGLWDIVVRLDTDDRDHPRIVAVEESLTAVAAPFWHGDAEAPKHRGTWSNFGNVPRLGDAACSPWEFCTGPWAASGLSGTQTETDTRVHFSLETPFAAWNLRNATHLPGDIVVFQLGDDQICVFDPKTRRLALVTNGRGPIAVLRDESPGPVAHAAGAQSGAAGPPAPDE